MLQPHCPFVPGGTYFFTLHLQDARADTIVSHVDVLRQSVRLARKRWPFMIEAAVVLPNVTHMIWTLPAADMDFSKRWRLIKSTFSRHVPAPAYVPPAQARRGEKGIWRRRFWEHRIRDRDDFDFHMRLIRDAPKTKGLVKDAADWPFSSFTKRHRQAPGQGAGRFVFEPEQLGA